MIRLVLHLAILQFHPQSIIQCMYQLWQGEVCCADENLICCIKLAVFVVGAIFICSIKDLGSVFTFVVEVEFQFDEGLEFGVLLITANLGYADAMLFLEGAFHFVSIDHCKRIPLSILTVHVTKLVALKLQL